MSHDMHSGHLDGSSFSATESRYIDSNNDLSVGDVEGRGSPKEYCLVSRRPWNEAGARKGQRRIQVGGTLNSSLVCCLGQ